MKTAGMVLGIIGGAMALITGITLLALSGPLGNGDLFFIHEFDLQGFSSAAFFEFMRTMYIILGITGIVGGALGLTGGILVRRKNVAAGVLLIVAAVLSYSILFVLAAIFALMKEKTPAPAGQPYAAYPPYPPYPPQSYAPYPPQQYQPQPYAPTGPNSNPTDGSPQG